MLSRNEMIELRDEILTHLHNKGLSAIESSINPSWITLEFEPPTDLGKAKLAIEELGYFEITRPDPSFYGLHVVPVRESVRAAIMKYRK